MLHKKLTFLIGPEVSVPFYQLSDDFMSQSEVNDVIATSLIISCSLLAHCLLTACSLLAHCLLTAHISISRATLCC
jgi:hypothetical protein